MVNPFCRTDHFTLYEGSKVFFGCMFLVPFRFAVALLILVTCFGVLKLCTWTGSARISRLVCRVGARSLLFTFGFYWINVSHTTTPSSSTPKCNIIISNHRSYLDILVFIWMHGPAFVMKREILDLPIVGWIAAVCGCIPVGRSPSGSASPIVEYTASCESSQQPALFIFPEGTTTNGSAIMPFKSGAFVPGEPVLPVVIDFPHQHFNCSHESILFFVHLLRLCSQFQNYIILTYLPIYHPSEDEQKNPVLFAVNVERCIANTLRVPVVECTYKDKLAWHQKMRASYRICHPLFPLCLSNLVWPQGCSVDSSEGLMEGKAA